jgi:hypothetical protein
MSQPSRLSKLLTKVQDFCTSTTFEQEFESFAKENSDVFMASLDYSSNEGEHPLEFFDVYQAYLKKFETKIENFIVELGYEPRDFYAECRNVLEDEDLWGSKRFFIEMLLATSEYEHFFVLMQSEMRTLKQKSESKSHK